MHQRREARIAFRAKRAGLLPAMVCRHARVARLAIIRTKQGGLHAHLALPVRVAQLMHPDAQIAAKADSLRTPGSLSAHSAWWVGT